MEYRIIVIIYITFVFLQLLSVKQENNTTLDKDIEFNINNPELDKILKNKLNEYNQLLKKMKYEDWVEYINKNNLIKYQGRTYYFYLYEYIKDKDKILINEPSAQFISLAHMNPNFHNITFKSVLNLVRDSEKFSEFTTNNTLLGSMYLYSSTNKIKEFSYFWINPGVESKEIAKKKAFISKFQSNNNSGILGIGYNIPNTEYIKQKYFYYIDKISYIFCSLLSFIIAYFILYMNNFKLSLLLLFLANLYIYFFINNYSIVNSVEIEKNKNDDVNNGILSISFLTAVNIFIISSAKKLSKKLFKEYVIVFSVSVILLMFVIYKKLYYNNSHDLIKHRVNKEFYFNYVIIFNIYIILSFIISILFTL
jgi:hypothetical protein